MAQPIRCPHCGKTYVMKPELAGKKVRCQKCQEVFAVTVPKLPGDALDKPILPKAAPAAAPSSTGGLLDLLDQELASGPTIERPKQGAPSAVGSVASTGQPVLAPVAARRRVQTGTGAFQRLWERKLTAAVAAVSLGLMFVFILLFFVAGLRWFFVVPPMVGIGLAALGYWLPVPKRRGRRGPWFDPTAARIAGGTGVIGVILGVLFGIMVLATRSGHPILPALGFSRESATIVSGCIFGAIGVLFAACFLTILISLTWSLVGRYGFLRLANSFYLGLSPVVLVFLCVCGLLSGWMRFSHPSLYQWSRPPMHQEAAVPPAWSQDGMLARQMGSPPVGRIELPPARPVGSPPMRRTELPPGAENPNRPDFYRANLADLGSADVSRRRRAAASLSQAQPKQLRNEITKALESLLHDSDDMVRVYSVKAIGVWSTGDVVPIAIDALKDADPMVRNSAIEILDQHKDPRAIEPLVAVLSDPASTDAAQCLIHMGSTVENAVLARFDNGNACAKRFTIEILGAVATKKGIAKLRKIASDDSDFASASEAKRALEDRSEQGAD